MQQQRIIWKMLKLVTVPSLLLPISMIAAPPQDVLAQDAGEPNSFVIEPQVARLPVYTQPPTFTKAQLAEMHGPPPVVNLPGPPVPMVSDDAGPLSAETVVPFGSLAAEI